MCCGNAPELEEGTSFVGRWMDILRPGYERIKDMEGTHKERQTALEKEGVLIALENLMTFPFIQKAVEDDTLALHGLWNNIRDGSVEYYNADAEAFHRV